MSDFAARHIGTDATQQATMLRTLGVGSMAELTEQIVPSSILLPADHQPSAQFPAPVSEEQATEELRAIAQRNRSVHSLIGLGCYETHTPSALRRHLWEQPGWYTAYTPYQAEISQGRLEMLSNFQQMVMDMTSLPIANASLLDEATAAAEAMALCYRTASTNGHVFLVDTNTLPQTKAVLQTRAWGAGIKLQQAPLSQMPALAGGAFGALIQYPGAEGQLDAGTADIIKQLKSAGLLVAMACDLLGLALLRPPGEMDADVAIGSSQRFGVPMAGGGPHAAWLAARDDMRRAIPGRIIGIAVDSRGRPALRMALQTREQHIRRERATSNICTAQVLPANLAASWAVYMGAEGVRNTAMAVQRAVAAARAGLQALGIPGEQAANSSSSGFGTLVWDLPSTETAQQIQQALTERGVLVRAVATSHTEAGATATAGEPTATQLSLSPGDTTKAAHLLAVIEAVASATHSSQSTLAQAQQAVQATLAQTEDASTTALASIPEQLRRTSSYLQHPVFRRHRSETALMRYLHRLQSRDLTLTRGMIGLGSCTMKLNAAVEMEPVSWPELASVHPLAPQSCSQGYKRITDSLSAWLGELTGLPAVSLQPNSGAQGEFAGLLAIRRYLIAQGEQARDLCLVPKSAHGTNPASAVMCGLQVMPVACAQDGSLSIPTLKDVLAQHGKRVAALMITYPSTHGVYEEGIAEICSLVHEAGGQVYMDGANFNAMLGLSQPALYGTDVCHLNLHKTFCIPHGGGGPGVGPICAASHLAPYLPGNPAESEQGSGAVASYDMGSAGILPISWMYIRLMGWDGLRACAQAAMLAANYVAHRLAHDYPVLYRGEQGRVAHECLLDLRQIKKETGVTEEDIAKRLMDYGLHAPTIAFPLAGTIMIEPTESENLEEIDRFCDAMAQIKKEIDSISKGEINLSESPLKNAPHTLADILQAHWDRPYSRQEAIVSHDSKTSADKFFPSVNRIDQAHGDRNLFCGCPPWLDED